MKHLNHLAIALLSTVLVAVVAVPSHADNDSIMTLGFGAGIGYRHAAAPGVTAEKKFVNQANVRLKLLWVLGLDLSVDLTRDTELTEPAPNELRFAAKTRLTALFYPIVTGDFGLYLGTGIGAGDKKELLSLTSPGNSYHLGGGLEWHITDHLTFDCSFYMIVPGYASMRSHVEQIALSIAETEQDKIDSGGEAPTSLNDIPLPDARIGDYINPKNYELMVRFFLFL